MSDAPLTDWIDQVTRTLGVELPPTSDALDLARDVAHGVARPAAPLTLLLAGIAVGQGRPWAEVATTLRALLPAA